MLKIFRPANHAVGIDNYCQHRAPTETDIKNHREGKKRIGFMNNLYITYVKKHPAKAGCKIIFSLEVR